MVAAAGRRSGKSVRAIRAPSIAPRGRLIASVPPMSLSVLNARERVRSSAWERIATASAARAKHANVVLFSRKRSVFIAAEQFFFHLVGLPSDGGDGLGDRQR